MDGGGGVVDGSRRAEKYRSDDYSVYEWLSRSPPDLVGGSEVNWNERLHSKPRGKSNRLARQTKGCAKSLDMSIGSLSAVWLRDGLI